MMIETLYGAAVSFRNYLFDAGVLKSYLVPPLVVSIGNIEAGGTGKTPLTMALASNLKGLGHNIAIVTRGYRGRLSGPVEVLQKHDYLDVGDEPLLMAKITGVPVIKSPDRCRGATFAYRKFGAGIILLDDAFQHRRIFRDLNICLISRPLDNERMLPMGKLREPVSGLKRADFIIDTEKETGIVIDGFLDNKGNLSDKIKRGKIFAFCGIANPERFFDTLKPICPAIKTMIFRDHHKYNVFDIKKIERAARGSDIIITTEKDYVRLRPEWLDERFHALRISMKTDAIKPIIEEIEKLARDRRISRQR
jgi:tetraacyldisaccharide 4'-kinase